MSLKHVGRAVELRLWAPRTAVLTTKLCRGRAYSAALDNDKDLTPEEIERKNQHHQQVGQLQDKDQEYLLLLQGLTNQMLSINGTVTQIAERLSPKSTRTAAAGGAPPGIPPYTLRHDREGLLQRTEHFASVVRELKRHLRDLQIEPYPDRSHSALHTWAREMRTWPEEQKREELGNARRQAEANDIRLRRRVKVLKDTVEEWGRMDAPTFGRRGAQQGRRKGVEAEMEVLDADRNGESKAGVKTGADSLLDMQAQLDRFLTSRGK